ncbi:hypothetical protein M2168_006387 [Streptomyces sp. CZ24]|nr:hypothetical protein [Streptomyces sp. CZ24]
MTTSPHRTGSRSQAHERSDIGLRRLLFALCDDTRVQEYAVRQLGRLLDHGTDLLATLRGYLDAAGHKTGADRSSRVCPGRPSTNGSVRWNG